MDTKSVFAEKKVKKNDLVMIKGTGSSRFFPKGVERPAHRVLAERLRAEGKVTIGAVVPSKPLKARVPAY